MKKDQKKFVGELTSMTEEQGKLFTEILDLNWDMEKETDMKKKWDLVIAVNNKRKELRASMGEEAYQKFMNAGSKLFSKKEG